MCKLDEDQLEDIACRLEKKLVAQRGKGEVDTRLTPEESLAVKRLLATKNGAVRMFLYIFGALAIWALKDIYIHVKSIVLIKGGG